MKDRVQPLTAIHTTTQHPVVVVVVVVQHKNLKFAPVTPDTLALNGQLPTGTRSLILSLQEGDQNVDD